MIRKLPLLCASVLFVSCSGSQAPVATLTPSSSPQAAPQAALAKPPEDPRKRIDAGVFDPYTKSDYPKLAAKLKQDWDRVQPLREAAAIKALENPRCQQVDMSEVSVDRSTRENLFAFVYCNNGKERLNFTEADVKGDAVPLTNSQKAIDRVAAITACTTAAKAETLYPSLADMHTWSGASFQTYEPLGSARVLLDFEATNALGEKLPYRANCLFPVDQPPELTITAR